MSEENSEATHKITCKLDGALVHSIHTHLKRNHPNFTVDRYVQEYPGEPLLSDLAKNLLASKRAEKKAMVVTGGERKPLHEVFGFGNAKAALNSKGGPIMIACMNDESDEGKDLIPDEDPNYVFDIELVKTILIATELNTPLYLWGYHGTGKTTNPEQICARTKRPFLRIQHTVNAEELHVLGQWNVRNGEMEFQYGPLPLAMINGWTYCADEYDRGLPSVLSVYQPVLEGKPLYIKEAAPYQRLVRPHPNFRFVGTGNTNGAGDETGLYQGTQMQDAANYSRFGVTVEVGYMEPKVETMVVSGQAGVDKKSAEKIVAFANEIRSAFKAGRMASTISPRELINAGRYAVMRAGDWRGGLKTAWGARLSRVDAEVADGYAQRIFC